MYKKERERERKSIDRETMKKRERRKKGGRKERE